jgi:ABC-2 type transport system ATP-binding protein
MIEVKNLIKKYGGVAVLDIPDLTIQKGESFGLVGNNGAGKTTLFSLILDLRRATRGSVFIKNQNVSKTENWKDFTGSYIDENFLIDFLTPEEYFQFIANLHGLSKGDLQDFYQKYEDLFAGEILGKKKYIRELSKGNQKKVGIAGSLLSKPEVLVLDEPFSNLDPSSQIRLKAMFKTMKSEDSVTMLISSHDLNHVTEVCERIVILDKGNIVHDLQTSNKTLEELESYFDV